VAKNLRRSGSPLAPSKLLKLSALDLVLVNVAKIVERPSSSFTRPCGQGPPGRLINVLGVLHPAARSLIRNTDHHCHQPLFLLLCILEQVGLIMWLQRKANPLHGPPEKRREWTLSRFQVKYCGRTNPLELLSHPIYKEHKSSNHICDRIKSRIYTTESSRYHNTYHE
jgi:hypothetical protein